MKRLLRKIVNKINNKKKIKGSLTVEATLLLPPIMFIFFFIIYVAILNYQETVLIAETIRAMNRAGSYWQYVDKNRHGEIDDSTPAPFDDSLEAALIINKEMIEKRNEFRTIIDAVTGALKLFGLVEGKKFVNTQNYVRSRIQGIKLKHYTQIKDQDNSGGSTQTGTNDQNNQKGLTVDEVKGGGFLFLGEDLSVTVKRPYINPLVRLSNLFIEDKKSYMRNSRFIKEIKVSSVVSNQAEFIRNIDTVYNLGSDLIKFISPQ